MPAAATRAASSASAPWRRSHARASPRKSPAPSCGSLPTSPPTPPARSSTSPAGASLRSAAAVLLGPTASGKSRLALELAEKLPVEIVVMDSAQVYRGMDIGTAKPAAAERARVPHHLIDLVDPDQAYSVGRWRAEAIRTAGEILKRGKLPLLVGGTMLYYRALTTGLAELPEADIEVRAELDASA